MAPNTPHTPTALVILDGFGYRAEKTANAPLLANMPTWRMLQKTYPWTLLRAEGPFVGLLPGIIGNSEVGHLTIGAGRVIESVLKRFHDAIDNQSFFTHATLIQNLEKLKITGHPLHIMGLLSEGGVHSHEKHLYALIKAGHDIGIKKIYVHAFLDGRDVTPTHAQTSLKKLHDFCTQYPNSSIAGLYGRFYAMDRDKNWTRTQEAYNALVSSPPAQAVTDWQTALQASYNAGITDEFFKPVLLDPAGTIKSGDGIIFFNFRPDRAQQISQAFLDPEFKEFKTSCNPLFFMTTTRYKKEFSSFNNPVLFPQNDVTHTLLDEIATQRPEANVFCIAETEKYAHVTYFFKGMRDQQYPREQRVLVPSIKAKNYIQIPEMSADTITKHIYTSLNTNPAYFYLVNYANADMVGHSGDLDATIKACECLDKQLTILYQEIVEKRNGTIFITADHGNAEQMFNEQTGKPKTSHTLNPVPCMLVHKKYQQTQNNIAPTQAPMGIAHIAPTILRYLGLQIPEVMCAPIDL